ncbi:MAG: hypothetical protein M0P02_07970 [Sulfurospirillaceae bacterium]|nr:hypothetical protein [Sulfurospirillaceae bacterium]MCK9546799.1 hypothetical protein [Sulfurospirillaceae bacterium]
MRLFVVLLFPIIVFANEIVLNKSLKEFEESKIFKKHESFSIPKESLDEHKRLLEVEDDEDEKSCIETFKINIVGNESIKSFDEVVNPYLNRCNGIKNLTNLRDKISNLYIDKGFITSRAYFLPQDLKSGEITINIIEGKIERFEPDGINLSNLFKSMEGKTLNIKDLEVMLQQAQRLHSQELDIEIVPSKKMGHSVVKVFNVSQEKSYNGNLGINNFGTKKTGKYQIYGQYNFENFLRMSDIVTINLSSTNRALESRDKTFGTFLNYSTVYDRFSFDIFYSYSNYNQINQDVFHYDYKSDGYSFSRGVSASYKLYHSKHSSLELLAEYENKKTSSYFENVKLELQSYINSTVGVGARYGFYGSGFNGYGELKFHKGIAGEKQEFSKQEIYSKRYILNAGFNRYFDTPSKLEYNLFIRGQYSRDLLFGTEEISMGGPYSVRGFNSFGLYGNRGFFIRNDLLVSQTLGSALLKPYLGLDYGSVSKGSKSFGGEIVGFTFGVKSYYKNFFADLSCSTPVKESENIKDENSSFLGFNFSYRY